MRIFYDRNIRNIRAVVIVLGIVDIGIGAVHLWKQNWFIAATCGIWAVNLGASLLVLRQAQQARDEVRILIAAVHQEER